LPQKSLQYDEHGSVWSLEKIGKNLVLVTNQYLHVVDVANAYNPQQISNFTRTGAGYDYIDIQSNYGYVICDEGFEVIDFSNILNPVKVGQYFNYEDPTYLEVDGRYVYLLDLNDGITFYDVTNKAHPKLLGSYDDNRDHATLTARNGYIFLAEGDYGTRILRTPYVSLKASLNVIYCIAGFVLFSVIGLLWQKKRKK
jgi:hypothetical protein